MSFLTKMRIAIFTAVFAIARLLGRGAEGDRGDG